MKRPSEWYTEECPSEVIEYMDWCEQEIQVYKDAAEVTEESKVLEIERYMLEADRVKLEKIRQWRVLTEMNENQCELLEERNAEIERLKKDKAFWQEKHSKLFKSSLTEVKRLKKEMSRRRTH
jgi:hypothetical protein